MSLPRAAAAGTALLLLFLVLVSGPIHAQDAPGRASDSETSAASVPTGDLDIIDMDIRTSTLLELAEWCRRLGLSDGGTKEDLAARLRTHYGLGSGPAPRPEGERSIVIESARSTEYFTLETVNEEYARLQGDVVVSLKEGDTVHRLKARDLLYNRTRNVLSASGGVEYRKSGEGTVETFRGESLVLSLDDWTGVFLEGASERSLDKESTTYRFAGRLISRDGEDVTVMTDAVITNAAAPEAYWSINASKLWLLPGSEWAILNGVLKVGEIPLLYIPFFFLPGDELVFHPVLGYRSREGSFLQTTTYILGRPKAKTSTESSITSILGSGADMERERQGIFLRSTGTRRKNEEEPSLSLLFDAYANLGSYLGTELSIPKSGVLGKTDLSFGLGLTRNVYQVSPDYYTPFAQFDGTSDWNEGRLFDREIPLRYRFKASGSVSAKAFNLSWVFPFYADPYVDRDFLNRSEDMDWFNIVKSGADATEEAGSVGVLGSYEWRVSSSANPGVPSLAPYLTSLSITNLSSSLSFGSRTSVLYGGTASPDRSFFYPDRLNLFSFSGSLGGRPLSLGTAAAGAAGAKPAPAAADAAPPAAAEGRSPWPASPTNGAPGRSAPAGTADPLVPPPLDQRFETASRDTKTTFSLDYRMTPSAASDLQFRSSQANWPEAEDIDWDEHSSILTTVRSDGTLGSTLSVAGGRFTAGLKFGGNAAWQGYGYMNEQAEEYDTQEERDAALLRTYRAVSFSTNSELSLAAKPLLGNGVWGSSNLQYSLKGLVAKSAFDGTAEDPSWEVLYGEWRKEDIDIHRVSLNLVASVRDRQQNLTLSADLPPEDALVAGDTAIRIWRTTSTAKASVEDPFGSPLYRPVTFTETVDFGSKRNIRQELIWDPELGELTSFVSSLAFGGLSASYAASYGRAYILEDSLGWRVSSGSERLRPKSLAVAYVGSAKRADIWRNRLSYSLDLDTRLTLDLQRYTYSTFYFTIGTTFKVFEFLDLSLNAKSQNAVVFRYLQDLPFWEEPISLPGERDPIRDLINSFRFDDEELRIASGYKLKAFELKAVHYMGDWTANLGVSLAPYLDKDAGPFRYRFNTQVSFLVKWIPISEIKTEVYGDKDGFLFK